MKKIYFLVLALSIYFNTNAQNYNYEWTKTIEYASQPYIAVDINGNTYLSTQVTITYPTSPFLASELYIEKYNTTGDKLWYKSFLRVSPTGNGIAYVKDIDTDASGNIYISGYFTGTVDLDPDTVNISSYTSPDFSRAAFVVKLDTNGSFIWANTLSSTQTNDVQFESIAIDTNENVFLTGSFEGAVDFDSGSGTEIITPLGSTDAFILKLNSNGVYDWVHTLGSANSSVNDLCYGFVINTDTNGNVYTLGNFQGIINFNSGLSTEIFNSDSSPNGFIIKHDNNGNFVWVKDLLITGNQRFEYAKTDAQGNTYILHNSGGTFDYDLSDTGNTTFSSMGDDDVVTFKLDANGDFVWARQFGSTGRDWGQAIAIDANNNVQITGFFSNTIDFDPNQIGEELTSNGDRDVFNAQLDANGDFVNATQLGDFAKDEGWSIAVDSNGGLYTAGEFVGQNTDLNPTQGTAIFNSLDGNTYIQKLTYTSVINNGIINIPDANFEQALIDEEIDSDGIINGQVFVSDVETVEYLDINSKNISDLTGIEGFIALETLVAHTNNLTTIDVSKNLVLSGLILDFNQLTTLDVSKNTELVSLTFSSNLITTIDLSQNLKLNQFYANNNSLTALDVTQLTNLEQLFIGNNTISEVNVTNNTALKFLNCSLNELTSLNLLSNSNLEIINCSQNNLEYLDLSQNPNLYNVVVNDNALLSLNIKNGANTTIINENFVAFANPGLTCVEVDDVSFSASNWAQIDMQTNFSENCVPVNNDCSFTIPIILGQDTPGNTSSASASTNNPNCLPSGLIAYDVWYSFPAPNTGSVTMTLSAPPFVGKVALYTNCSDTQPIYCAANELVVNNLIPGATYYLQVWLELPTSSKNNSTANKVNNTGSFTLNIQDSSVLSVTETQESSIAFHSYPNPVKDILTITSKTMVDRIAIYNLAGQEVISKKMDTSLTNTLNLETLNNGIYFLKVIRDSGIKTQKIIVSKN